jgi:hypothetical protein
VVLAESTAAYTLSTAPTRDQFTAARRARGAYTLFEDRITDSNLANAKNSWGAVRIEDTLTGPLDLLDTRTVWTELDVAFAKRTYAYSNHAETNPAENLGTAAGVIRAFEGRTYYGLIAPGVVDTLGVDTAATVSVWDDYAAAIAANDATAAAAASAVLAGEVCDYMVALGAWNAPDACATSDGPSYASLLAPDTTGAAWDIADDPAAVGAVWSAALVALKANITTASADGALDHAALGSAYAHWKTLAPVADAVDPERVVLIEDAFAAFSVAIQVGDSPKAAAWKQVVEKSVYTVVHRAVVAWAAEAAAGDTHARDLAYNAYLLIRDRVTDANVASARNSLGDAVIVTMLTGDPAGIDAAQILRELNVAFAKRTLAYTTHGLPSSEGGSDGIGTSLGYARAVEGRTYWSLIAPSVPGADLVLEEAAWGHWAAAIRRNDLDEVRWASAHLQGTVCAYMIGELGLTNCSTADTSTEEGS